MTQENEVAVQVENNGEGSHAIDTLIDANPLTVCEFISYLNKFE